MSKYRALREHKNLSKGPSSAQDRLQAQLQTLIEQHKYRQALDRLKQIRQAHPDITISPSEADIWLLCGQQEFAQGNNYRQAESSFRKALELGLVGEVHYWLAKTLLASARADEALETIRTAFESKQLPKDYAGCYLKLLFLQGQAQTVETLIKQKSQQFLMPQVHWARGVLALQAEEFADALKHFQKMGRPATPEDAPSVWVAYALQRAGKWSQAEANLPIPRLNRFTSIFQSTVDRPQLAKQRLLIAQSAATGRSLSDVINLDQKNLPQREIALALELLHCIDSQNYHDAAHTLQDLGYPCRSFPEVDDLYFPILRNAGEEAIKDQEPECTKEFWGEVLAHPPFDPQLAFKLQIVCDQIESYRAQENWLNRLINWLKQEAKQNPQDWPAACLNQTLADLYCRLADNGMATGQQSKAIRALKEAEHLCPDSAEVKGRKGLEANMRGRFQEAVALLTQALEGGCTSPEVYGVLLDCLEKQNNLATCKDIRRRFGQKFGDVGIEVDVDFPAWVEVLATQNYLVFEELTSAKTGKDPALQACRIFIQSNEDDPNADQRVTLDQAKAAKQWDRLLQGLVPQDQIPVLQAIVVAIQLFAKRKKGIAALSDQYFQRIIPLMASSLEAAETHLIMLVVKAAKPDRLKVPIQNYLARTSQAGTALAQVQLKARKFVQTDNLRTLIEDALRREPQNPQLLLALATTFAPESDRYKALKEQGFELARRLQDAPALQAFRDEDAFCAGLMAKEVFPDLLNFGMPGGPGMEDIFRKIAQKMFGNKVPPDVLEAMLPELMKQMGGMPDFDDDDEFDFNPFGKPPTRAKKTSNSRRRFPF